MLKEEQFILFYKKESQSEEEIKKKQKEAKKELVKLLNDFVVNKFLPERENIGIPMLKEKLF